MTRIDDPDFGPIDLKPTTDKAWEAASKQVEAAIEVARHWPAGKTHPCPRCRNDTLTGSDNIRYQTVDGQGHVHTFYNLRGASCSACGLEILEPADLVEVEKTVRVGFTPVFTGKVSRVGRGTLGTYWSRDVERNLGLHAGDRLDVELVGRDSMLVRVHHEHDGEQGKTGAA